MLIIHDLTPEEAGKFDFGENRLFLIMRRYGHALVVLAAG